jgi:hypothetical protein
MDSVERENLERILTTRFDTALQQVLQTCGTDNPKAYDICLTEFWRFCDAVAREREMAYPLAAQIIATRLLTQTVPRALRSLLLTVLARWPFEALGRHSRTLQGKHVAHFAQVLRHMEERARYYVEWFEDMGNGIPLSGDKVEHVREDGQWFLAPQSTRMMRGILFASRVKRDMDLFWKLAAETPSFPERIFTDPGDYDRRCCYMTQVQMAQLAAFFTFAPEAAVRRFARSFSERVQSMQLIVYASLILPGGGVAEVAVCDPKNDNFLQLFDGVNIRIELFCEQDIRFCVQIEVPDERRQALLRSVSTLVQDEGRRQLIREIFYGS